METQKNSCSFDPDLRIVVSNYSGYLPFEHFTSICLRVIELLKEHNTDKKLIDNRQLGMLTPRNREWIQKTWFPLAVEAGLKRMAFIMPNNIFGKVSTEDANRYAHQTPVEINYFYTPEEAVNWLIS